MMLVHSFSRTDASLADFLQFAAALEAPGAGGNRVSGPRALGGIGPRLAWVSDTPSA